MRLADQFPGGTPERLLEPAELLVARRALDPAGFDQREVRLGDAGLAGQLVEGEPQPAALAAKFGAERFHDDDVRGPLPRHDVSVLRDTDPSTHSLPDAATQEKYRTKS